MNQYCLKYIILYVHTEHLACLINGKHVSVRGYLAVVLVVESWIATATGSSIWCCHREAIKEVTSRIHIIAL